MTNEEINRLAAASKAGDSQAFGQLFDQLADPIYRFMAIRVRDTATAQDLTSEVFLEAWQGLSRYDTDRSFKTWIFTIARYNLIDYYRRHRPTAPLELVINRPDSTDIKVEAETQDDFKRVLAGINQLPELYQTVLQLKFIEELDYTEIAQITGKTENHLRVIVKRGVDRLRRRITNNE